MRFSPLALAGLALPGLALAQNGTIPLPPSTTTGAGAEPTSTKPPVQQADLGRATLGAGASRVTGPGGVPAIKLLPEPNSVATFSLPAMPPAGVQVGDLFIVLFDIIVGDVPEALRMLHKRGEATDCTLSVEVNGENVLEQPLETTNGEWETLETSPAPASENEPEIVISAACGDNPVPMTIGNVGLAAVSDNGGGEEPTETGDVEPTETGDVEPTETGDVEPTETGDVEPTETGDVEPTETGDVEPTETGDVEPTETGDVEPTETGDVEPTETGDVEPTETGDVEPTETGDVEPTETGDVEPTETGDVEPTETGDVEPTETGDVEPTETGSEPQETTTVTQIDTVIPQPTGSASESDAATETVVPTGTNTEGATEIGSATATDGTASPTESSVGFPDTVGEDFTFFGCLSSNDGYPSFEAASSDANMDLELCASACAGSNYFGVVETDCFCGETVDETSFTKVDNDQCDLPCPGKPEQFCGGRVTLVRRGRFDKRQLPTNIRMTVYVNINIDGGAGAGTDTVTVTGQVTATVTAAVTDVATVTTTQTTTFVSTVTAASTTELVTVTQTAILICVNGHCGAAPAPTVYIFKPSNGDYCYDGELVYVRSPCTCHGGWEYAPKKCSGDSCKGQVVYKPEACANPEKESVVYAPESCQTCGKDELVFKPQTPGPSGPAGSKSGEGSASSNNGGSSSSNGGSSSNNGGSSSGNGGSSSGNTGSESGNTGSESGNGGSSSGNTGSSSGSNPGSSSGGSSEGSVSTAGCSGADCYGSGGQGPEATPIIASGAATQAVGLLSILAAFVALL